MVVVRQVNSDLTRRQAATLGRRYRPSVTAAVLWLRRDLRLADNPALVSAAAAGQSVVPLFVLDDVLRRPAGAPRLAFLYRCLRELDERMGGRLVVRTGAPEQVVPAVVAEVGATSVHLAADFGPYGARRDAAVRAALGATPMQVVGSPYAVAPGRVRKDDGSPFRVFSPYYRAWVRHGWRAPAGQPHEVRWADGVPSDGVPDDPGLGGVRLPPAGELAARSRWAEFTRAALAGYAEARNAPAAPGTTRLSVYLKYGCVHPRTLLADLGASDERLRQELAWRDFYADVLFHSPDSARQPLQSRTGAMLMDSGPDADRRFDAWAQGRTGFPIVDAGMRQLHTEAWMHNRVRMITSSFFVKDLHLPWQRGARFFLQHLCDGDLASNNQGWQWVAGTGTDPAPYFRVFNPVLQGQKFDADGSYVRRYVPELRGIEGGTVHEPWKLRGGLPEGYPARIVDHAVERAEALRRYEAVAR